MSRTEDYLDGLLNSVSKDKGAETEENNRKPGGKRRANTDEQDDFLSTFEQELFSGEDTDDFLRQFERELAEEEGQSLDQITPENEEFFDKLDGIVNSVKEKIGETESVPELLPEEEKVSDSSDDMDIMVDTLGELPIDLPEKSEEQIPEMPEQEGQPEEDFDLGESAEYPEEDPDLMELLNSEGNLSDIEIGRAHV